MQRQHFAARKPILVSEQLRQIADALTRLKVSRGRAKYQRLASGWTRQTEKELDRGRFSGSVWAQEAENFAASHGHAQTGERRHVAIPFCQVHRVNDGRVC